MGNAHLEASDTEFRDITERSDRDEEREVRYNLGGNHIDGLMLVQVSRSLKRRMRPLMKELNETSGAGGNLGWRCVRNHRSVIPNEQQAISSKSALLQDRKHNAMVKTCCH